MTNSLRRYWPDLVQRYAGSSCRPLSREVTWPPCSPSGSRLPMMRMGRCGD